jgi:hypothetical protein
MPPEKSSGFVVSIRIFLVHGAQRGEHDDLAEGRSVRERSDRLRPRALRPRQRLLVRGAARAHLHVVAEIRESRAERLPDVAGSQYADLHVDLPSLRIVQLRCEGRDDP